MTHRDGRGRHRAPPRSSLPLVTIHSEHPFADPEPERDPVRRLRGRLGVAGSVHGRMADLGGTARVTTAPGQGTEWELELPV